MSVSAAPALQPRSAPQLFDAIFQVARRHAWDLFALGMLFHLPVHLFRIAGAFAGSGSPLAAANPEHYVGMLWWSIWNSLAVTAGAVAACQVYGDGTTSVRRALDGMRAGGWRLLGTVAAYEVLVDGSYAISNSNSGFSALAGLAFIVLVVYAAPAIPAAFEERVPPWSALRRAFWLVRKNSFRVAVVVWIVWGLTNIADSGSVSLIFSLSHRATVAAVADLVVDGALYPLRGIVLAVVYFDCRIRREGYDLERMIDAA